MIRRSGTLNTWVVSETYVHLVAHVPSFCLIGIESTRSHPMSEGVTISSTSDCTLRYLEMASPNFFKSNTGFPDSVRLTVASAINSLKYLTDTDSANKVVGVIRGTSQSIRCTAWTASPHHRRQSRTPHGAFNYCKPLYITSEHAPCCGKRIDQYSLCLFPSLLFSSHQRTL